MRRAFVVALLITSIALSGCFDPYRARVPDGVIEASGMDWNATVGAQVGSTFGTKTIETRYVHLGDGQTPYPGVLQVFSIRGGETTRAALLAQTEDIVDRAIAREGISIDSREDRSGERLLADGQKTSWFSHEGRIATTSDDSIFLPGNEQDLVVRILGEVTYDGKAKTAAVMVAFVQVGAVSESPVPGIPPTTTFDEQTWNEVVGDPQGTMGNTLPEGRGFIYNLRTHG